MHLDQIFWRRILKKIVDRNGWSKHEKMLNDVRYFPLFLVGLAPRYKDEWSGYFEGSPTNPQYGGWAIFCVLIMCLGAFLLGVNFGKQALGDFQSISLTEKTVVIVFTPILVTAYAIIGFMAANFIFLPFQFLNSIKE